MDSVRWKRVVEKRRVDKTNLVDDPKATAVKMNAMISNFFSGELSFLRPEAIRREGEVNIDWRF
jgi:hypothetical protein